MRRSVFLVAAVLTIFHVGVSASQAQNLTLIGRVPTRYIPGAHPKDATVPAQVVISNGVISDVKQLTPAEVTNLFRTKPSGVLILKRNGKTDLDIIYPGLINLHNHTKQNNLPVWSEARGQFANRFEWRDWGVYKKSVSANMNPWVDYGKAITCAVFRWSELQAMVLGTTHLQGPSSCVDEFGIHRVEDAKAYGSTLKAVQAPTDIILPGEMAFVWKTVRQHGQTYEEGLANTLLKYCPKLRTKSGKPISPANVNSTDATSVLSDQEQLKKGCEVESAEDVEKKLPQGFIRYVYWVHKTIASRKLYLNAPGASAVIGHLAEGRRQDPYNRLEFELLKFLGLDLPYVNLVHGVGIDSDGFKHMAKKKMGLIWSPFSNFLLYGETVDLASAKKAGVTIALGSDWLPTGTRGVLEELKIARHYVADQNELSASVTDEDLYLMVTENPAKMIRHFEDNPNDRENGIGAVRKGARASLIVVSHREPNVYTNLVLAEAKDINLVLVDGVPQYGNVEYLEATGRKNFETLPADMLDFSELDPKIVPGIDEKASAEEKEKHLVALSKHPFLKTLRGVNQCRFVETKGFVHQDSLKLNGLDTFAQESGLNLDRFSDIQKLIGINLLTQSRNHRGHKDGDPKYAVRKMTPLFSCHDQEYQARVQSFVGQEIPRNRMERRDRRTKQTLGNGPKSQARQYDLPYDQDDF